ncbi:MAG: flagellar hook capping FlgD N-terminal domain-containing protein [Balneolales bacterium]
MELHNINSQISATFDKPESKQENQLGQQHFLQLLVAQMRHQDPINPMDGSDLASRLAQFNSVEQLINVNNGIKELHKSQELMGAGLTNSLATSLAGKQVKAVSNIIHLPPGEDATVIYKLNNQASKVDIVIKNESGNEVRRESLQNVSSSLNEWKWNGRNNNGERMPDGMYNVEIVATGDNDSNVGALTYVNGLVEKVRYTSEGVKLTINGVDVPVGDVEEIGLPL